MNLILALQRLRDDIKSWVTVNLNALDAKFEAKVIPVEDTLNLESNNPVQNQVVSRAIQNLDTNLSDYRDLANKPEVTDDCSDDLKITDKNGNIIAKIDSNGIWTTQIILIDTDTNLPYKVSVQNGSLMVNKI